MSTSCVGCKFLYGDGSGYSNYTWMETYIRCALNKNALLTNDAEQPTNWPPTKPHDDKWLPTINGRCGNYSEGIFILLDPDREDHPADQSADDEQIKAICASDDLSYRSSTIAPANINPPKDNTMAIAPQRTIAEIEAKIGVASGSNLRSVETLITLGHFHDLGDWLILKGIPVKEAQKSLFSSRTKAYIYPPYLSAWRRKVNPSYDLLDHNDDDNGTNTVTNNIDPPKPIAAPSTSNNDRSFSKAETEIFLKQLYSQVETTVNKLVDERFKGFKFTLDETAKNQIKALGRESAEATIRELMPPRTIEINNIATGISTNLGLQHEQFPILLRAVQAKDHRGFRLNVWLTGPTGSGKTSACESVAKALSLSFGSDGSLDADYKVLGFRDANGNIISTQFLDIYENGGIYVADEIDNWMPSALLSLNAALANGWVSSPKGMIQRHKDACVIACANTWGLGATGEYVGRTRLDAASLDRFQPKINWPYDEKMERAIANNQGGEIGTLWHETIVSARRKAAAQGLKIIISPRATFNGISLLNAGFDWLEVIDMTVAAGISAEQKKSIGLNDIKGPSIKAEPTTSNQHKLANSGDEAYYEKLRQVAEKAEQSMRASYYGNENNTRSF